MRRLTVLALAVATLALTACGGGEDAKLLPGTTAAEITENLESVKQLAGEGECVGAANAAQSVSTQVDTVEGIDPKLKQALERGAEKLNEVVTTCEEETEAVAPADEATTEETTKLPPGQEKKEEKEREKEESKAEKELEKQEKHEPAPPAETTPEETPTTPAPPTESGGTGAPGGVSPGTPVGPGGE